ncbi:hypothetical protein [Streptomyces chartreusis]|uniref:hypothetical protein n=1 Tax=Streptomyces chartreusis TaxID=1969 RepID=UPI00167ADF5C|nr:hypothetical protein [Streptomyces chartreusis]
MSDQARVVSTQDYEIDPVFAVAVIIVDSALLPDVLGGDKFGVIVDPVGGFVRTQSLDLLAPEPAVEMPVTWPAGSSG